MSRKHYAWLGTLDLGPKSELYVSQLMKRTERGDDNVIVAPIAEHSSPDDILREWDKLFNANKALVSKDLLTQEMSNRSKFGPRSIAIPWVERRSGVQKYFGRGISKDRHLIGGLHLAQQTQPLTPRLRPISIDRSINYLKNSTNSGLPFTTRKGNVKDIYGNGHLDELLARKDPCLLFTRTQEMKKTRPVWGYPMADTIEEMCFFVPLLEYQKRIGWRAALLGPDEVDVRMVNLVKICQDNDLMLASYDFSAYDTDIKTLLQETSFDYIRSLFQAPFHDRIHEIALRFRSIGLVTPDGLLTGEHGVPSGSTFTNEVDSIAQYKISKQIVSDDDLINIQGDDGGYGLKDPDKLSELFQSYGLTINEEKSTFSKTSIMYLQKLYDLEYIREGINGGIYSSYRALNRIIYPERFQLFQEDQIEGSDYWALRTIAILENCKYHPLFKELVRLVWKHDKYNLKYSIDGLRKYIKRINATKGITGLIKNQYGDEIQGILNFETVKVLQEIS